MGFKNLFSNARGSFYLQKIGLFLYLLVALLAPADVYSSSVISWQEAAEKIQSGVSVDNYKVDLYGAPRGDWYVQGGFFPYHTCADLRSKSIDNKNTAVYYPYCFDPLPNIKWHYFYNYKNTQLHYYAEFFYDIVYDSKPYKCGNGINPIASFTMSTYEWYQPNFKYPDGFYCPADSICKCTTQGIPHDFIGCPVA